MPLRHYYAAADLLTMPEDGNKYEVVHGELLVTPSPRMLHQRIVSRLIQHFGGYLQRCPIGEAYPGGDLPAGEDSLVIPDVLVLDLAGSRAANWSEAGLPLLVVEVLSPGSVRQDRFTKRRLYQEVGVPAYWLVDAGAQAVEVWTPDARVPRTEHQELRWHPPGASEPLVLLLADLFREV